MRRNRRAGPASCPVRCSRWRPGPLMPTTWRCGAGLANAPSHRMPEVVAGSTRRRYADAAPTTAPLHPRQVFSWKAPVPDQARGSSGDRHHGGRASPRRVAGVGAPGEPSIHDESPLQRPTVDQGAGRGVAHATSSYPRSCEPPLHAIDAFEDPGCRRPSKRRPSSTMRHRLWARTQRRPAGWQASPTSAFCLPRRRAFLGP